MNRRLRNKLKYEGSVIPHDKYGDIVVVEYQTTEEVTARFVNTGFTVTTSLSNLLRGGLSRTGYIRQYMVLVY